MNNDTYTCRCCARSCTAATEPPVQRTTAGGGGIAAHTHYPLCSWCGAHEDEALFTYAYQHNWPCPYRRKTVARAVSVAAWSEA